MDVRTILAVAYFVLAIYMYGGGVMSTLCYYKSWDLVGAEEFPAVHQSVSKRILPFFVPVLFALVLVNILPSGGIHVADHTDSDGQSVHSSRQAYGVPAHSQATR